MSCKNTTFGRSDLESLPIQACLNEGLRFYPVTGMQMAVLRWANQRRQTPVSDKMQQANPAGLFRHRINMRR